jgi:hypothetical protein
MPACRLKSFASDARRLQPATKYPGIWDVNQHCKARSPTLSIQKGTA